MAFEQEREDEFWGAEEARLQRQVDMASRDLSPTITGATRVPSRAALTPRAAAEAVEQFGDDLAALVINFDRLCSRMGFVTERINAIPDQDALETIAEAFRKLGDELCRECDATEEADDRRRDNPLEPDFRRLGQ